MERSGLVAGAVVNEIGARAEGCRGPFATAIVAGHHDECGLLRRGELRGRRETGIIGPDESEGCNGFYRGKRLSWRRMLKSGAGRYGPRSYRVERRAVTPIR